MQAPPFMVQWPYMMNPQTNILKPVNRNSKSMLARLLATENIRVEHNASAETAMFDIKNRVLVLPIWESMTESMYDMLVGHEVSHALHTPMDEWEKAIEGMFLCQQRNFQQVCNVVEDARIERLIKDMFPGLKRDFSKAYEELHNRDLFDINNKDVSAMGLIDRLNLEFKLGLFGLVQVPFSADEKQYVTRMAETETFTDVLALATDLFKNWKQDQEGPDQQNTESQESDESQEEENDDSAINGDSDDAQDDGEESQDGGGADEGTEAGDEDGEESQGSDGAEGTDEDGEASQESTKKEKCDCPECTAKAEAKSAEAEAGKGDEDGDTEGAVEETDYTFEDYSEGGTVSGPSETQEAMDKAVSGMKNTEVSKVEYYALPTKMNLESSVVDFTKVRTIWDEFYSSVDNDTRLGKIKDHSECIQFLGRSKSVVNHMVQQFQMKQAADEDKRTNIAKTGVLDTTSMINYRWSEDIFRKNQVVSDGKNHGMIIYLDWSGSMDSILKDTVEQLLILTEFCNKIQIPFEVYAFTSRQLNGKFINDKGDNDLEDLEWCVNADDAVGCQNLRSRQYSLINFLSSRMNARQYKTAVQELYKCSFQNWGHIPSDFSTGCTPLNEAILCSLQQVPEFQERTGVQIVNTVFLTDGEGHSMGASGYRYSGEVGIIHDTSTRRDYELSSSNHKAETNAYLEILKQRTQCNIIGIRLHCAKNVQGMRYGYIDECDMGTAAKSYTKNNYCVASADATAYDEFFIVKGNLNATEDIFEAIEEDASFAKIKNAFAKSARSTKTSRVIATKMIEIFAST